MNVGKRRVGNQARDRERDTDMYVKRKGRKEVIRD